MQALPFQRGPARKRFDVVTSEPDACTASTVHDLMALPSSRTVQAPPIESHTRQCVPVRLKFAEYVDQQQPRLSLRLVRFPLNSNLDSAAGWGLPDR